MNELLNIVNLPMMGGESPPGVTTAQSQSIGDGAFALLLSQLGQEIPALALPGMTKDETQEGDINSAAQMPLLQLLGSVGLTGQQPAMDGSFTGSLPINEEILPQGINLLSLDSGIAPTKMISSAQAVLMSALPVVNKAQTIVVTEQQPSADVISANGKPLQLPVELMLNGDDLARLQSLLLGKLPASLQSVASIPDPSGALPVTSAAIAAEMPSELDGLRQLLREQFPALNIENLSAQLHLKSPELLDSDAAPVMVPKTPLSERIAIAPAADRPADPVLQQTTPQDRPQVSVLSSPVSLAEIPLASATQTTATHDSPVIQPAYTEVASPAGQSVETPSNPRSTVAPETVTTVKEGNLEKTAVKATEATADYSQPASQWSKSTSDQPGITTAERTVATQEPQADRTRFQIQFDRFQIDALLQRSEIKLQLHPAALGSMRVKLVSTSTEVTARFETTNENARAVVEQNLSQLREAWTKPGSRLTMSKSCLRTTGTPASSQYQSRVTNCRCR